MVKSDISYKRLPNGRLERLVVHKEWNGYGWSVVRTAITVMGRTTLRVDNSRELNPKCRTPGAIYVTNVREANYSTPAQVSTQVLLPPNVKFTEEEVIEIERKTHDFFEKLLANKFKK